MSLVLHLFLSHNTIEKHSIQMKERLIILSDLWGRDGASWIDLYMERLASRFNVVFYDSCELGKVDKSDYSQDVLHRQFVGGGVDRAVEQLIALEQESVHVIAFSIGGVIAWRFGLQTDRIKSLHAISSTRLRYETEKPSDEIVLFFGAEDDYQPDINWYENLGLEGIIISHHGHLVYQHAECANVVCRKLNDCISDQVK